MCVSVISAGGLLQVSYQPFTSACLSDYFDWRNDEDAQLESNRLKELSFPGFFTLLIVDLDSGLRQSHVFKISERTKVAEDYNPMAEVYWHANNQHSDKHTNNHTHGHLTVLSVPSGTLYSQDMMTKEQAKSDSVTHGSCNPPKMMYFVCLNDWTVITSRWFVTCSTSHTTNCHEPLLLQSSDTFLRSELSIDWWHEPQMWPCPPSLPHLLSSPWADTNKGGAPQIASFGVRMIQSHQQQRLVCPPKMSDMLTGLALTQQHEPRVQDYVREM